MKEKICIFWFRRDLRWEDNRGLYHALKSGLKVLPIFIFDPKILSQLEDKKDRRVDFIFQALEAMNTQASSPRIKYFYGAPLDIYQKLIKEYDIQAVFTNEDYEPYAISRDQTIETFLGQHNIPFHKYKDQVIFAKDEILKKDGTPYTVYTPYAKVWLSMLAQQPIKIYQSERYLENFYGFENQNFSLDFLGFLNTDIDYTPPKIDVNILKDYDKNRDYPALDATSKLGVHLRFGTISPRKLVLAAQKYNIVYLKELIWREFFMQILWHFPYVVQYAFRDKYQDFQWRNNEEEFKRWCEGQTGFPLVDAGMRELNATGFMHNRVRMLVASFLVKDLQVDWRWGEVYFAQKLIDFDLAQNNGNWQWVAGTGVDAAPYFRVFNPNMQLEKFDKHKLYIAKWVPEYGTPAYPQPMLDHTTARLQFLSKMNDIKKDS